MQRLALVPPAVLLACAATAHAQSSPYTVGVSETVSRISNFYNRADGDPGVVDATRYSTALFASVNQTIGRQRVFGNANVANNRYSGISLGSNNSYSLLAGLDWSTIERLSGSVQASAGRSLAPFYGISGVANQRGNVQDFRSLQANARLGLVTRLGLESSLGWRQVSQSNPVSQLGDYEQHSGSLGLSYRFSGALQASAGVSAAQTEYDSGVTALGLPYPGDTANRRDVYVAATYVPSGLSSLSGRLATGHTKYDRQSNLNLKGVTGSANYRYQPTAKLSLGANVARDTGTQIAFTSFIDPTLPSGFGMTTADVARVSTTYGASASYAITAKVSAQAGASQTRRTLVNTLSGSSSEDNLTGWNAGLSWAVTRTGSVGCNVGSFSRDTLGREFNTRTVSCFGQIALTL